MSPMSSCMWGCSVPMWPPGSSREVQQSGKEQTRPLILYSAQEIGVPLIGEDVLLVMTWALSNTANIWFHRIFDAIQFALFRTLLWAILPSAASCAGYIYINLYKWHILTCVTFGLVVWSDQKWQDWEWLFVFKINILFYSSNYFHRVKSLLNNKASVMKQYKQRFVGFWLMDIDLQQPLVAAM